MIYICAVGLLVVSSMWLGWFSMAYLHVLVVAWLPFVLVINDCWTSWRVTSAVHGDRQFVADVTLATKANRLWTTATHGTIGEFDGSAEGRILYIERLGVLLCHKRCHATWEVTGYSPRLLRRCLIRSLAALNKPTDVSYRELVDLFQNQLNPRPSLIVQRLKSNSRTQQPGESIASYVAELRRLSEHCGYGQSLDEMFRDRVRYGPGQDPAASWLR